MCTMLLLHLKQTSTFTIARKLFFLPFKIDACSRIYGEQCLLHGTSFVQCRIEMVSFFAIIQAYVVYILRSNDFRNLLVVGHLINMHTKFFSRTSSQNYYFQWDGSYSQNASGIGQIHFQNTHNHRLRRKFFQMEKIEYYK